MNDQPDILVGRSVAAGALDRDISAAAHSDAKVLITGESGVGKEVSARLIHAKSPRAAGPFVALNCAGVPDSLLESELFGHVRGSFTGAYRDKPGLLEAAHGGTVFLDEVGEMSLRMQAMLLRFLESGEIQRVGADRPTTGLNVRVICATNRSLSERVAEGAFREDLYYRLNVVHIHVPPLRERRHDLPEMVDHFRRYYSERHGLATPELAPGVLERLIDYRWPGNIRELRNVVERLVVRACNGMVTPEELPRDIRNDVEDGLPAPPAASAQPADSADAVDDRIAREIFSRMVAGGASFWEVVHAPFMAHDLTRRVVRRIVALGLERTGGHHTRLVELFNMTSRDYRRLVTFLRKHDCLEQGPTAGHPAAADAALASTGQGASPARPHGGAPR